MTFETNWLQWPVKRTQRSFRTYVVEPAIYAPETHKKIFDAALSSLIANQQSELNSANFSSTIKTVRHFDLIVFPEAFLASDDLIQTLNILSGLDEFGCVHVGLRASDSPQNHLFSVKQIVDLIKQLKEIPKIETLDLKKFEYWVSQQEIPDYYNLGCLFTIDSQKKIRICMHAKIVRSKFEVSALPELHMKEANLISLVTLVPDNKRFMTVTVQPMICSDALGTPTDSGAGNPLEALGGSSHFLRDTPPDHIDIVSLSLCTPQKQISSTGKGKGSRAWHQQFRESFVAAAKGDGYSRHHFSTFVMSNFRDIPDAPVAGLSGAFMSIPMRADGIYPKYLTLFSYGAEEEKGDDIWIPVTERNESRTTRPKTRKAHLACLDPDHTENPKASMLGFTLVRLLRDNPKWEHIEALAEFELRTLSATAHAELNEFTIEK